MSKPAKLHRATEDPFSETQLRISGRTLILLMILVFIFFIICFNAVPQTYGFL